MKILETQATFSLGQLVHHRLLGYRGVIFDVDPHFQGKDQWYEEVADPRPGKEQPWYHVLVDGGTTTSYVAQQNLEHDLDGDEIFNPGTERFFDRFGQGAYHLRGKMN